jgi:hypothetical protein
LRPGGWLQAVAKRVVVERLVPEGIVIEKTFLLLVSKQ